MDYDSHQTIEEEPTVDKHLGGIAKDQLRKELEYNVSFKH